MYKAIFTSVLLAVALTGTVVDADTTSKAKASKPLKIRADHMEIDYKIGETVLTGNVVITQGGITITAVNVQLTRAQGEIQHALIQGTPAHFTQLGSTTQSGVKAQAKRMEYDAVSGMVRMFEDALLEQGNNRFTGEEIDYDMRTDRVTATNQANMTYAPTDPKK